MRKPLAALMTTATMGMLFKQLDIAFSAISGPLCYIPGTSRFPQCHTLSRRLGEHRKSEWADYPKLIDIQTATFEQLLDESKAEVATRDLTTLVRVSALTSKERLANLLAEFVQDAKHTGRGLQRLNAKIGGAVDSCERLDYAARSIEAAKAKDSSSTISVFWPFASDKHTRDIVLQTFHDTMRTLSAHIQCVTLEATLSLNNLEKLEESLTTLHELVSREDASLASAKNELLGELWTRIGGNRRFLRNTMQGISEEMEEMRDRVAAPDILGERIPVEIHIKSINSGLERLTEGRMEAKEREEEIVKKILGDDGGRPMLE
ncbi:hypothetical protein CERSUDRAFT_65537 [Gelatoporia subvermispora B]|uniref:Fungal N-terminal domain-containing protein n=1 Tax=Ceriporiopsis subvermispora (strain B) TaxID=914234 RepID=M2QX68_CERS8|nr:hypothetical protein CERSUDRAFT_65537 [Gelatoporia subvermispora B]